MVYRIVSSLAYKQGGLSRMFLFFFPSRHATSPRFSLSLQGTKGADQISKTRNKGCGDAMLWPSARASHRPDPARGRTHLQRLHNPSRIRTRTHKRESPSSTHTGLRKRATSNTPPTLHV